MSNTEEMKMHVAFVLRGDLCEELERYREWFQEEHGIEISRTKAVLSLMQGGLTSWRAKHEPAR